MTDTKKRHLHRRARDGEPYTELGTTWQRPFCECGKELTPRRVGDVPTGAKPPKGRGK